MWYYLVKHSLTAILFKKKAQIILPFVLIGLGLLTIRNLKIDGIFLHLDILLRSAQTL
jgi:hypothetical protein